MQRYLARNYNLAHGLVEGGDVNSDAASDGRPTTAASIGTFLYQLYSGTLFSGQDGQTVSETEIKLHKPANGDNGAKGRLSTNLEDLHEQAKPAKDAEITDPSNISSQAPSPPLKDPTAPSSTFTAPTCSCLSLPITSFRRSTSPAGGSSKTNSTTSTTPSGSISTNTSGSARPRARSGCVKSRLCDTASSIRGLLSSSRVPEKREKRYSKSGRSAAAPNDSPRLNWELPDLKI